MSIWISPITLYGRHVRLEPMTEAHIPALAEIGVGHTFWDFMVYGKMETVDDMRGWVTDILSRAKKGTDLPFVAIHLASGRVAGATRYLNIVPNDRGLEVGGTWYGVEFQRSAVNTECKYLLFKHAFETLGCEVVSVVDLEIPECLGLSLLLPSPLFMFLDVRSPSIFILSLASQFLFLLRWRGLISFDVPFSFSFPISITIPASPVPGWRSTFNGKWNTTEGSSSNS